MLTAEGYHFDFVGSLSDDPSFGLPYPHHEGHPGWQASDISGQISGWLTASIPDVVFLHIGTNDISITGDPTLAASRLSHLIGQITGQEPNVRLFVASIVPRADSYEALTQQYNALIPSIVLNYKTQGFKVEYVDIHSALTLADLADAVHPNQSGYNKMATRWNAAFTAPEPGSFVAIGLGLAGISIRKRKPVRA